MQRKTPPKQGLSVCRVARRGCQPSEELHRDGLGGLQTVVVGIQATPGVILHAGSQYCTHIVGAAAIVSTAVAAAVDPELATNVARTQLPIVLVADDEDVRARLKGRGDLGNRGWIRTGVTRRVLTAVDPYAAVLCGQTNAEGLQSLHCSAVGVTPCVKSEE